MKLTGSLLGLAIAVTAAADGGFTNWNGLLIEKPVAGSQDHDFFNRDNTIYKPGREFVYSYTITKNRETLYCRVQAARDTETRTWSLVAPSAADDLAIRFVGFKILPGYGGLDELFPEFSQTVIQQKYWSRDMTLLLDGSTGLVENKANVWLHPFRAKYFSVTEFSPFPFVKYPLDRDKAWDWKLEDIDTRWSDPRIIVYTGKVAAEYRYRVRGAETVRTPLGELRCVVTEATASNRLGSASLRSWFHPDYGFVRLDYKNIDGSEIRLELERVVEP